MMSKGHYKKAEKLLQHIATTNKRSFDKDAFELLKNEQEKVISTGERLLKWTNRLVAEEGG